MMRLQSFQVDTKIGGGRLDIFEKSGDGYFAQFHGLSGLAHQKKFGRETPDSQPVDFEIEDATLENLIKKCRIEIERRDSDIVNFVSINN